MTAAAPARRCSLGDALPPAVVGLGSLVAFFLVVELLIQIGVINRFIVPPPSEIIGSFGRGDRRGTCVQPLPAHR